MKMYRYLILGGGVAGGSAIDAIRQVDREGSLALVSQEIHRPYDRPPLSKGFLLGEKGLDDVYMHSPDYYTEQNVDLLLAVRAANVNPKARIVVLEDDRKLSYGRMLLATGGKAKHLNIPGHNLPGVFTLRSIEDAESMRAAVSEGMRVLVLGGSFIGSEVASSLAQLGAQVTMVFPDHRLLETVAPLELSKFLEELYSDHGVTILPRTTPTRLVGSAAVEQAILNNKESLDIDMAVMGVGIQLNTDLARGAGLALNQEGAIVVDETLCTSNPSIYAAGDIAEWPDPYSGQRLRVEHWDVAKNQGIRAGRNMADEVKPYTTLPYFFSDLFDVSFEVWGSLEQWDQTMLAGSLENGHFAFYYLEGEQIVGVLAADASDELRKTIPALVKQRSGLESVAQSLESASSLIAAPS